jgi:hypothetical protein
VCARVERNDWAFAERHDALRERGAKGEAHRLPRMARRASVPLHPATGRGSVSLPQRPGGQTHRWHRNTDLLFADRPRGGNGLACQFSRRPIPGSSALTPLHVGKWPPFHARFDRARA